MKTTDYNYKKYLGLAGTAALIIGFIFIAFWQTNFEIETAKAGCYNDFINGKNCKVCQEELCGCESLACCDNCPIYVDCSPFLQPEDCNECASCGDSRYRWCEGGSYGFGECVDYTCGGEYGEACRPDLCGGEGGPAPGGPAPLAPDVDLMGPATIEVPNSIILSWNSSNADSCSASGDWSGGKATSGSETLTLPRGTYTFRLDCSGSGGSDFDEVTIQIIQVPQCTFWADPSSIIIPQSSALRWTCQYADSCSINQGVGSVCFSESECSADLTNVRPKQTTAYTLICNGLDGSRSYDATVNVGFIPKLKEILPPQLNWLYSEFGNYF